MGLSDFKETVKHVMLTSAARTTSSQSSALRVNDLLEADVFLDCTVRSGTNPSLEVKLQGSHDGTTWFDFADGQFQQLLNIGRQVKKFTNFGKFIRADYTIAGTNASFTFDLVLVGKF